MKKYHGAMIGCGYVSAWHLKAWKDIEAAKIVAVCDLDLQKAEKRASEFGIENVYTDYQKMISEMAVDFVDIATPPASHPELVTNAAARGLHVLCQKPFSHSMADAYKMVTACDDAGVTFMVLENYRHYPWFRHLRTLLDEGSFGLPIYARLEGRWRSTLPTPDFEGQEFFREMPHLIIFELGVHYLDTLRYLFGEATSVYTKLRRVSPHIQGEDFAVLVLEFDELTCLIDMNWFSIEDPDPTCKGEHMRLEGSEGTAFLKSDRKLILKTDLDQKEWKFPQNCIHPSIVACQQHFIDCVNSGQEPETSGAETIKTMALVFAAYRSAAENRVVMMDESFDNSILAPKR